MVHPDLPRAASLRVETPEAARLPAEATGWSMILAVLTSSGHRDATVRPQPAARPPFAAARWRPSPEPPWLQHWCPGAAVPQRPCRAIREPGTTPWTTPRRPT